jgi:hypothetical protein
MAEEREDRFGRADQWRYLRENKKSAAIKDCAKKINGCEFLPIENACHILIYNNEKQLQGESAISSRNNEK